MKLNELFEQLSKSELSIVAHACNPSIVEAEMGAVAASPRSYCSNTTEKQTPVQLFSLMNSSAFDDACLRSFISTSSSSIPV